MHTDNQIYQFAASAGALEGYVYGKKKPSELDLTALSDWVDNLTAAYRHLPEKIRENIQPDLDRTLGRTLHSLKTTLEEKDPRIIKLAEMIRDRENLPASADDFNKKKWFANDSR